jgi:hypothetical protein
MSHEAHGYMLYKARTLQQELIAIEQELFTQLVLHLKVGVLGCLICYLYAAYAGVRCIVRYWCVLCHMKHKLARIAS